MILVNQVRRATATTLLVGSLAACSAVSKGPKENGATEVAAEEAEAKEEANIQLERVQRAMEVLEATTTPIEGKLDNSNKKEMGLTSSNDELAAEGLSDANVFQMSGKMISDVGTSKVELSTDKTEFDLEVRSIYASKISQGKASVYIHINGTLPKKNSNRSAGKMIVVLDSSEGRQSFEIYKYEYATTVDIDSTFLQINLSELNNFYVAFASVGVDIKDFNLSGNLFIGERDENRIFTTDDMKWRYKGSAVNLEKLDIVVGITSKKLKEINISGRATDEKSGDLVGLLNVVAENLGTDDQKIEVLLEVKN